MEFIKMQGAGNDFVVIRTGSNQRNWSKLALEICHRHYGVGADGLLLMLPSQVADFKMRLFNADGSESNACGNGMRCLVKLFIDEQLNGNNDSEVSIETPAGIRKARVHRRQGKTTEIHASMGKPRIGHNGTPAQIIDDKEKIIETIGIMNRSIRVNGQDLLVSLVTIGNPHAVHFYNKSIKHYPLASVGPQVEQYRLFPDETNFEVARVINRKEVEARVWEKGCGETFACGTGACAITIAGNLLGYLDSKVKVRLPGGALDVEWDGKGEVYLGGPAATVFHGDWL